MGKKTKSSIDYSRYQYHVWNHPRYRDTMTSQDIYDAVLDHSVKSINDFWKYMEKKE